MTPVNYNIIGASQAKNHCTYVSIYYVCMYIEKHRPHEINEDSLQTINCLVKLAGVSTRCSSHPQGKSEARCENAGVLIGVAPALMHPCRSMQRPRAPAKLVLEPAS